MTDHAAFGEYTADRYADEVRAELARQKRTANDAATALGLGAHTVGRRLRGEVPFTVVEGMVLEMWLGLAPGDLMKRATLAANAVAS